MKKYHWLIIAAVIVLLAVFCIVLGQQKNVEYKKMEQLCQSSAHMALEEFEHYKESGEDSYYMSGVAEFRSFMTAYLFLNDNISDAEYGWCNMAYGEMLLRPERVQANVQDLVRALEYLSEDYDHPNGFQLIHTFVNQVTSG